MAQKKELNINKGSRLGLFDKLSSPLIKSGQLLTDTESSTSGSDTESETGSDSSSSSTNSTDSSSGSSTDSSGSDSTSTDSTSTDSTNSDSTSSDSTDSTSTDSSSSSSWNGTSSDSSSEDSTSGDSTSEDSSSGTGSGSGSGSSSDSSDGSTSSPVSMSTSSSSNTGGSCDNSQVELGEGWSIMEVSVEGVYVYDTASGTFIREDGAYSIWINTVGQLTVGDSTSGFMFISYIETLDAWTDDNNPAVNSDDETNWEAGDEMVTFETGVIASYCDGDNLGTALCSDDGTSLFPDWYSCEETDGGSYIPAAGTSGAS